VPRPSAASRWSRPVLVIGAVASLVVSWRVGAKLGVGVLAVAVLVSKVLDELAAKRAG
jgi:hypothetical protein